MTSKDRLSLDSVLPQFIDILMDSRDFSQPLGSVRAVVASQGPPPEGDRGAVTHPYTALMSIFGFSLRWQKISMTILQKKKKKSAEL